MPFLLGECMHGIRGDVDGKMSPGGIFIFYINLPQLIHNIYFPVNETEIYADGHLYVDHIPNFISLHYYNLIL
jgi:hypothetical protein